MSKRAKKSKRKVFQTPWFFVEKEEFAGLGMGKGKAFYRVVVPPCVLIFAVTPNNKIVMVKQFRPAIHDSTLEIPAGEVDKGETPAVAARRELYEETGYRPRTIHRISGKLHAMAGRFDAKIHIFLAKGAVRDKKFKSDEDIETILMSSKEFKRAVKSGKILEMGTIAASFLCQLNSKK